jgi:hypothetical protein
MLPREPAPDIHTIARSFFMHTLFFSVNAVSAALVLLLVTAA